MKVIKPVPVTEAVYSASNIPEPDSSQSEVEWIPDIFSGFDLSYLLSTGEQIFDLSSDGGFLYALKSGQLGAADIIKLNEDGTDTGISFSAPAAVAMSAYDGSIYTANGNLGEIKHYDTSGSLVATHDVSAESNDSQGVCTDGTNFYVLDFTLKTVFKYNSSFTYTGESFNLSSPCYGLEFKDGYIYTTNISDVKIKKLTTSGTLASEHSIAKTFNPLEVGGGAWTGDFFVIPSVPANRDSQECIVYKYKDGTYDALYLPKERVIKTTSHKVYECAIATDLDPETAINNVPPEWVEVKTTNKFALVDTKVFSPSISATPITISLTPGEIVDSVAAFELVNVTTVDISAISAASGSVYNNTITLNGYPEFVDMDIPPFSDLTITITFNGTDIEVGEVVTGLAYDIGKLLVGVQDATKDYSRQEFDEFGNLEFVKRPIVNQTTYPIAVAKDQAFNVKRLLNSLRGTAAVWVGDTGGGFLLTTYGYVERAPMVYDNQSVVKYQIKVRGSI